MKKSICVYTKLSNIFWGLFAVLTLFAIHVYRILEANIRVSVYEEEWYTYIALALYFLSSHLICLILAIGFRWIERERINQKILSWQMEKKAE